MDKNVQIDTGKDLYRWTKDLFPLNRSLTGEGVRETLRYLQQLVPELEIKSVASGYRAFDWEVPDEWEITEGYIENERGERIVDFSKNNLHVVGYSTAVDEWMDLDALNQHLYSLEEQPDAIPYITSYYKRRWGFCMTHEQRESLEPGKYRAVIRSRHFAGVLNYGEVVLPGDTTEEVFLSTYVCHPSMANNELSGPMVTTGVVRWLKSLPKRKFTYRIVYIPETIGSLVYLSKNLQHLKDKVVSGFNINCVGDNRTYSFLPSRNGETTADMAARHVLQHIYPEYKSYTWLDRGSDERQYCAPGVDLPITSMMRSKFGEYPEYHTSLDNLDLVSPEGYEGALVVHQRAIEALEANEFLTVAVYGEPQLGKRGLYPTLSAKGSGLEARRMMNLISYCDGKHSLLHIAELIGEPIWELIPIVNQLIEHKLLVSSEQENPKR